MNDWDAHDWVAVVCGIVLAAAFVLLYVGIF